MPTANPGLIKVAWWNIGAFVIGIAGASLFDNVAFLAFGVGTVGLITFFGVLANGVPGVGDAPGEGHIRRTIALTVIAVYAVLVASMAFFDIVPSVEGLLLNFTTLATVVIAFYFGSSAYLEGQNRPASRGGAAAVPSAAKAAAPRKRAATPALK